MEGNVQVTDSDGTAERGDGEGDRGALLNSACWRYCNSEVALTASTGSYLGGEMKLVRKMVVATLGLALIGGVGLVGIPTANATSLVDCGNRTDFFKLTTDGGRSLCFVSSGDAATTLYGLRYLSTGNNSGWVTYRDVSWGIWYDSPYRPRWFRGSFNSPVIGGAVHIR